MQLLLQNNKPKSIKLLTSIIVISSILAGWSPHQEVALVFPFAASAILASYFVVKHTEIPIANCRGLIVFFGTVITISLLHMITGGDDFLHLFFWLLTHASILMIIFGRVLSAQDSLYGAKLFVKFYIATSLIESVVAIVQYFQSPGFQITSAAGDYVVGTLRNNSHLFAMKILLALIIISMLLKNKKNIYYIITFILFIQVWLLGSALHTIIIILLAIFLYWFFFITGVVKKSKIIISILVGCGLTIWSLWLFQENNIYYLLDKLSLVNLADPSGGMFGKVEFYYRTIFHIPYRESVWTWLFGFGPGTYSSRASWILSGNYLSSQSYVPISPSEPWQLYLKDIWNVQLLSIYRWAHGVANQPFATWLTVLGEFGIAGLSFFIWFACKTLNKFRHKILLNERQGNLGETVLLGNISIMLILFILVGFLFDNWLEYSRLMMPLILFLSLTYRALDG